MKEKLGNIREAWEKALAGLRKLVKNLRTSPREDSPHREKSEQASTKRRHLRILGAYLLLLIVIMTGFILGQGQRAERFSPSPGGMEALLENREAQQEEEGEEESREVILYPQEEKVTKEREEGQAAAEEEPALDQEEENFMWPLQGEIIGEYHQVYRIGSQYRLHQGIDLKAPPGTSVQASLPGRVEKVTRDPALGEVVVLSHPGDLITLYGNLAQARVEEGQEVKKGQEIALVGETALLDASPGSYLHFEVREGDISRDPMEYLP